MALVAAVVLLVSACSSKGQDQTAAAPPATGGSSATAAAGTTTSAASGNGTDSWTIVAPPEQPDVEHLHYSMGPLKIEPGQNNIAWSTRTGYPKIPKPTVDGFIVGIRANLVRPDGSVPPVDVIHLHHGVWANASGHQNPDFAELFFAAGEEKTATILPAGYGYPYKATDVWVINYMLHNLLATPDEVSITYDLDFIPKTAPERVLDQAGPARVDGRAGR